MRVGRESRRRGIDHAIGERVQEIVHGAALTAHGPRQHCGQRPSHRGSVYAGQHGCDRLFVTAANRLHKREAVGRIAAVWSQNSTPLSEASMFDIARGELISADVDQRKRLSSTQLPVVVVVDSAAWAGSVVIGVIGCRHSCTNTVRKPYQPVPSMRTATSGWRCASSCSDAMPREASP